MDLQQKTQEIVRILGLACGLAVCGVISGRVFAGFRDVGVFLVPIPFALLCGVVCVRPWRRLLPAVVLVCLAWQAAYAAAVQWTGNDHLVRGMYLAGLIGGLGVGLAMAVGWGRADWLLTISLMGAVGSVSAWPFTMRWPAETDLSFCFVTWQVSVGMCVYVLAVLPRWRGEPISGRTLP